MSVPYGFVDCLPSPKPEGSSGGGPCLVAGGRLEATLLTSSTSRTGFRPIRGPEKVAAGRATLTVLPTPYVITKVSELLQEQGDSSVLQNRPQGGERFWNEREGLSMACVVQSILTNCS